MRDYDEHFECFDDTRCYQCGYVFPADLEIDDDSPEGEGFCSTECQRLCDINRKRRAKGRAALTYPEQITPLLYRFLCEELERTTPEGWSKSLYKGTDCGAWLTVNAPNQVLIGSIVEGADVDCETQWMEWPFTREAFWTTVQEVEDEANDLWYEYNAENGEFT